MRRGLIGVVMGALVGLAACSSESGGTDTATGGADTVSVDGTVADSVEADTEGADTEPSDTGVYSDVGYPPDTYLGDTTPPADTAADTADAGDDADDAGADTSVPECTQDLDCSSTAIVPPNECVVLRCIEGTCQLAAPDCDDGDPCTLDACDPHMGCVHPEFQYDIGSSRVWYCPGPVAEDAARAACTARGSELAIIGSQAVATAYSALLLDFVAPDVWVSPTSQDFCAKQKRVALPTCQSLDTAGCTVVDSCFAEKAFLCEIACNDGDPCTRDLVGDDGLCTTAPDGCDDGDACTVDSCSERDGCVHTLPAGLCDDGVPCTTDSCDAATGDCAHTAVHTAWDATHQLLACPGPLTWSAARTRCLVEGAVLAMPTTSAQEAQLAAITQSLGATADLWAPLKQQDGGNQPWDWTDAGGSGAVPFCASVQPNFDEGGRCGAWVPIDACVLDGDCTATRSFGCVVDTSIP